MGCCQHFPDCLRACVCHVGGPDCSGEAAGREGAAGGAGGGVAAARVAHAGPGGGTCNLLPGSRCRTQQPGCPQAAGGPSAAGHLRSRRAGFRGPAGQDAAPLCRHGLGPAAHRVCHQPAGGHHHRRRRDQPLVRCGGGQRGRGGGEARPGAGVGCCLPGEPCCRARWPGCCIIDAHRCCAEACTTSWMSA